MPDAQQFFVVLRDAICGVAARKTVQLQFANFAILILLELMALVAENLKLPLNLLTLLRQLGLAPQLDRSNVMSCLLGVSPCCNSTPL